MNDYCRLYMVIKSCITESQLDVAERMIGLYQDKQMRIFALSIHAFKEVIRKPKELRNFLNDRREDIRATL